jgi:phosphoglycerate kinase
MGAMSRKTLVDLELSGKRVLVRVDFNVPLQGHSITDDTRIQAALPTIRHLLAQNSKVILMSHLGRPKGELRADMSLKPVARRLSDILGFDVILAPDCIGEATEGLVRDLQPGQVLLLENLRFHKAETENDPVFAKQLAAFAEVYVNDSFGTAHRAHASTAAVAELIPERAVGFLVARELKFLGKLLESPQKPFIAILGGAKVSGKIDVIENLLPHVDTLLIGGAMMFTFWRAQGLVTGKSLVEDDRVEMAKAILAKAETLGAKLVLPTDCIVTTDIEAGIAGENRRAGELGPEDIGVDIGEETRKAFSAEIAGSKTIFWNGPLGVFEKEAFAVGTLAIAKAVADVSKQGAVSIVGGGDSVAAVRKMALTRQITHVSTGGGASLKFLEGKQLPGISVLDS